MGGTKALKRGISSIHLHPTGTSSLPTAGRQRRTMRQVAKYSTPSSEAVHHHKGVHKYCYLKFAVIETCQI